VKHTIIQCEQGTPEWLEARLGRVTGSRADAIMAEGRKKGEPSIQRVNYCYELAEQRVTGQLPPAGYVNDAMKWGTEHEPYARMAYEGQRGLDVVQTGFIRCDDVMAGCSLDGHVVEAGSIGGIIEIKCPALKTHVEYLKAGALPSAYKWQITHNLLVTGASWADFVSYRPGFQMFVQRVHAKDLPIDEYHNALTAFLVEVDQCEADIRNYATTEENA
jgi:exodeoxyribonuclease (lambda-induced)